MALIIFDTKYSAKSPWCEADNDDGEARCDEGYDAQLATGSDKLRQDICQ